MSTPANDSSPAPVKQEDLQTTENQQDSQTPQNNNDNNDNRQWHHRLSVRPERKSNPLPRNSEQRRKSTRPLSEHQKKKSFVEEFKVATTDFKLDPHVAARIDTLRGRHKVAFLSSSERGYYPEDPGHTKFAQNFQAHLPDPTVPSPQYYVDPLADDRLNKPISKKGYGIAGLSAPRFAKEHGEKVPPPNQYQRNLKELLLRQHKFPPQVWLNYGLLGPEDKFWDEKVARKLFSLWGKCHQINVGFGKSVKEPRFGKNPLWNLLGPGSYPIREMKAKPPQVFNAFLRGPARLNPATKLHCSYGPKENCLECGVQLMGQRDYYRSRLHVNPVPLRPLIEDTEEDILRAMALKKVKSQDQIRKRAKRVLLCRECYCKALRGESRFWKTRSEVIWLFEKTRHCGYIHEHNGIPEYTLKASCNLTRRLARKEAILSRHYSDKCDKKLVEKKQKYQS